MEEINLKELFKYFLGKWKIILIITIAIIFVGSIYSAFIKTPMYKSTTKIVLVRTGESDSNSITQNDVTLNQKLVSTYREIVKSTRVLNKVIKSLKLDMTYEELYNKTIVESVSDTEIIKISVVSEDASEAKEIANEIANTFSDEVTSIYQIQNISILEKAEMRKKPYNKNFVKEEIIYVLIGLVAAFGTVFVMFYFDTTIKTVEEVEEKFGLPILGQIPMRKTHGKKGGRR